MFELHVLQAEYGDCLIVKFGKPTQPQYILIDGGPEGVYQDHLSNELRAISSAGGKLELAILSHIDTDHITGLLDLMAELEQQKANNAPRTIAIDGLWHNSFSNTLDRDNTLEPQVRALLAGAAARIMTSTERVILGIDDGDKLRRQALSLPIQLNQDFPNGVVSLNSAPNAITFGDLSLRVVGPTEDNLAALRKEWLAWLNQHQNDVLTGTIRAAAMADQSKPNLSSIVILAEAEEKRLLLTGDGRGDHLLDGLQQAGQLDRKGQIHVDVLKLSHHGSDRDVTKAFFKKVTADVYLASANGRDGNPDLATLIWLVEAAKEQGRKVTIVVTNETNSTEKLAQEYPPDEYGYEVTAMAPNAHSIVVPLA